MDSWEWNKIAGAVLGTLLFVLIVKFTAEAIYQVPAPAKPGYVVDVPEEAAPSAAPAAASEPIPDFASVLPAADTAHGRDVAGRCQQCHDIAKGGANKIGPNLWGLIDRARAAYPGFDYSRAMSADHNPWTYEKLFVFLKAPSTAVPGTKMSFAGLRSAQERLDLLAYLRSQADSPAPLPEKK
jgi:cytochrome c